MSYPCFRCIIFKMTEIELKARIFDVPLLQSVLNVRGDFVGHFVRCDSYYRKHSSDGYPLRFREEDGPKGKRIFLTFKKKSVFVDENGVASEKNEEKESEISENAKNILESFFESEKIALYVQKEKIVDAWKCRSGEFAVTAELCEVKDVGFFIELEILLEQSAEKNVCEKARQALLSLLDSLGVSRDAVEEKSYSQLLKEARGL